MRKRLLIVLLIVTVGAMLFVSCKSEIKETTTVVTNKPTELVGDSPAGNGNTTVTIPQGGLKGGDHTLSINPESVEGSNGESVGYCLDLSIKNSDGSDVTDLQGETAAVETYIAKGLDDSPTVVYHNTSGGEDPVSSIKYDKETGKLTFNTKKLGEFYIVGKNVSAVGADNADKKKMYDTISDAVNGGAKEVIFMKDAEENVEVGSSVTLDLNGKTLSSKESMMYVTQAILISNEGDLTIKNGTVKSDHEEEYAIYNDGGTLTIEDGTFATTDFYAIALWNGATVIVNGGTFNTPYDYAAFVTNGNDESSNNLIIKDGTFNGVALYFPSNGAVTITGGTFNGTDSCIYQKSGTLNILGGTFTTPATLNGDGKWIHSGGYYTTGDAIIIEACGYPSGNPTANILGGKFNADGGHGIVVINWKANESVADFNKANIITTNEYYEANIVGHASAADAIELDDSILTPHNVPET